MTSVNEICPTDGNDDCAEDQIPTKAQPLSSALGIYCVETSTSRSDEILTMPNPFADKHPHKEGTQEEIGSVFFCFFLSFVRSSNCSSSTWCLTSSSISIFLCLCACSNSRRLSPFSQSKCIGAVCLASTFSCVLGMHLQGCRARKRHWNITLKMCFLPKEVRGWGEVEGGWTLSTSLVNIRAAV